MGQLINLSDKSFLREHPFLNPFSNPASPEEFFNAFIYPGDELVMWHRVSLPDDVSADSISDIKFISAKASIMAQKPQVFSEEFNMVFKSTRNFELDSFVVSFNNSNATIQPWGADGYAPNIHLQQDRNWKLPSGDFRRQINFFTKHTASTDQWDYWFYYPILFRWEYWLSLIAASDDFFNLSDPQEGKNHWWYHYFVTNQWRIISRLDLTVLISGVETIIRTQLDLTPGAPNGGVKNYSSNSDWINKNIKTSFVGGTLSNSPAFIYGNKDTKVVATFQKDTHWDVGEKAKISAVIWIEPFEGSGITARTRGSSLYAPGSETIFKGLGVAATDADGLAMPNDSGQFAVLNVSGNGALVLFDISSAAKVNLFAVIDYVKLGLVYPGVKRFTIYARLYNSLLRGGGGDYENQTRNGEEIKQDLTLISPASSDTLCEKREPMCPWNLDVFGDLTDTDDLKNDRSGFYQYGDPSISNIIFVIGKKYLCGTSDGSAGGTGGGVEGDFNSDFSDDFYNDEVILTPATIPDTFEDFISGFSGTLSLDPCVGSNIKLLAAITNNDLGRRFAFGKSNDFLDNDFEDDYGKKYTGLLLEWRKVLQRWGEGMYQIYVIKVDVYGNAVVTCDPRTFCLKAYNCNFIDRSVRIEVTNEGLRGSLTDPRVLTDYAGGWYDQYRLRGLLKFKTSPYVKEFNQYGESSFNKYKPIINEQQPKYELSIKPIPGWMDFVLSTNVLQADEIIVTDYNTRNRHVLTRIPVMNDADYTPRDSNLANPLADVTIALAYGQNNLRKRNSQ